MDSLKKKKKKGRGHEQKKYGWPMKNAQCREMQIQQQ